MIWERLIIGHQRPRFEGLVFGIEYDGKKLSAGRMLKFDTASNGPEALAISK